MNALELADALESAPYYTSYEGEAAAMLRQQQEEIVRLKLEWQVWFDMTAALKDRIAFLEAQVHGGTTK